MGSQLIKLSKRYLGKESILHELNVPAVKELLHHDKSSPSRNHNYRQIIGMLTYLQGTTRTDISMAVHQCDRFSSDPKRSHEKEILELQDI